MSQMAPNYPFMTSKVNEVFVNPLVSKYGFANVVWPIVMVTGNKIDCYFYERTKFCEINSVDDNRPASDAGIEQFFVDYTSEPRSIVPPSSKLTPFIQPQFNCSYDFVLKSDRYSSVDIDYVWYTGKNWKGIEFTTLWMALTSQYEAERLVKMFTRRPSWQGPNGPHGIRKQIDAAADMGIDYYMICANSIKVSNRLVTDGNAYWFPLTHENVDRILAGTAPKNGTFGTFAEMINWL